MKNKENYYEKYFKKNIKRNIKDHTKEDFNVKEYCNNYLIDEDYCYQYKLAEHTNSFCCDGYCFSLSNGTCHWYEHKPGKYNFNNAKPKYSEITDHNKDKN